MQEGCYAECVVKRKMTAGAILGLIGMTAFITAGLLLTLAYKWGAFVLVAAAILAFIFYRFLRVEYEFIFVTGELQVDRIYSGAVRKKGPRIDITSTESVEKITEERYRELKRQGKPKVVDYTSGMKDTEIYELVYSDGSGLHSFLFEPDEKLLKTMWKTAPSKVHIPRN